MTLGIAKRANNRAKYGLLIITIIAVATVCFATNYLRPISPPTVTQTPAQTTTPHPPKNLVNWPDAQSSIGSVDDGILLSSADQKPKPTASTAKLITVLTVLNAKPLAAGQQGPTLTMTERDVQHFNYHAAIGGSYYTVRSGDKLTQYQMIQGILIHSANNLADSLAEWAFGSFDAYQIAATKYLQSLGLTQTTVGDDASGLSPNTTSTANDLTLLGIAAIKNSIVRNVVKQSSLSTLHDGSVASTNFLLGQDGVIGVKTGTTSQAGGVFVIAADHQINKRHSTTLVATVQGAPNTPFAINEAKRLVDAVKPHFVSRTVLPAGTQVGTVSTAWGATASLVTATSLTYTGWKYTRPSIKYTFATPASSTPARSPAGSVTLGSSSTQIITKSSLPKPSIGWRLLTFADR